MAMTVSPIIKSSLLPDLDLRQHRFRLDAQNCQVEVRVGTDNLGLELSFVLKCHFYRSGIGDHMGIGDDQAAFSVEDDP